MPGRPANLEKNKRKGMLYLQLVLVDVVWIFFSRLSFIFLSPSLRETARYRLKYCLKEPINPKQPATNQSDI